MKSLKVNLPLFIFKEGESFVAYTPVLDLSSSGKTPEQARKRFQEAVDIFFEETLKKNTLEHVLRDLGWKKIKQGWNPPRFISHESKEISIPVPA